MFSVAYVFRRPAHMTTDEFDVHYRDVHGALAAKLPGLTSYTQHPVRRDAPPLWHVSSTTPDFDAISVYTFESDEAAAAAFESPENGPLQEDSVRFIDFNKMITLPVSIRKVV